MEARDSASAPFPMALRRALGHGSTVCAQPIAGGHTRRAAASPPLSKFRCKVGGPIYLYRERSYFNTAHRSLGKDITPGAGPSADKLRSNFTDFLWFFE